MILLIDNYDSFSYNVYQLVGSVNPDIRVIRNDAGTGGQNTYFGNLSRASGDLRSGRGYRYLRIPSDAR